MAEILPTRNKSIARMTKDRSSYHFVHFMTPGSGFSLLGCGHTSYSQNALFLQKSSSLLLGTDQTNYITNSNND